MRVEAGLTAGKVSGRAIFVLDTSLLLVLRLTKSYKESQQQFRAIIVGTDSKDKRGWSEILLLSKRTC